MARLTPVDELLSAADRALRTLTDSVIAERPNPAKPPQAAAAELSEAQRREAAILMRVNHVGEVCAQALYEGQAVGTSDPQLKRLFREAAEEEVDHLAWTRSRIEELGGRTSLLNPLWFAGAFGLGLLASRLGGRASLGFMAETENQVERHLAGHLHRLPETDLRSRAIVEKMREDESQHADTAIAAGAIALPWASRLAMRLAAKVMTTLAHRI